MEINNVGYVNFQGNKIRKPAKTKSATPKSQEASESADSAFRSYGQVFRSYGQALVNIFKKNIQNPVEPTFEIKELTDEEFKEYKAKLGKKIKTMPHEIKEKAKSWHANLNKTNIFLADKMLSDERLYGNEKDVMRYAGGIISNTDSKEKADARIAIIDKILSDERLCGNENFMNGTWSIIYKTESKRSADKAISLIDKYDKEGFLDKNDFVSNLGTLLTDTLKGTNE